MELRVLLMVVILMVVIVGFVAQQALALGEPGDTEGDEREGLAPEKQMAGMAPLDCRPDRQTDHHSHANDERQSAHAVDSVSIALVAREWPLRRGLAKEKDADVAEDEKHERGEHGMRKTQFDIARRVAGGIRIERREKGDSESKDAGQIASDLIVEIVTLRRGEKSPDGAQGADVVVAHGREVIVADGALDEGVRQRVSGTEERGDHVTERKHEGERERGETYGPAHEVVGEDSRVFCGGSQWRIPLHRPKYCAEAG